MKRFLITGMSAAGKSSLIRVFSARGFRAIDLDSDDWSEWICVAFQGDPASPDSPAGPGRDWVWRADRVRELLDAEDTEVLFVSGCAENMKGFLTLFDRIILLCVPEEILLDRLSARQSGSYGSHPQERARVLGLVRTVEPKLRAIAHHIVDSSASPEQTASEILRLLESSSTKGPSERDGD